MLLLLRKHSGANCTLELGQVSLQQSHIGGISLPAHALLQQCQICVSPLRSVRL